MKRRYVEDDSPSSESPPGPINWQWADGLQLDRDPPVSPPNGAQALMMTMVFDAVRIARGDYCVPEEMADAWEWIFVGGGQITFETACDASGLDPVAVRGSIRQTPCLPVPRWAWKFVIGLNADKYFKNVRPQNRRLRRILRAPYEKNGNSVGLDIAELFGWLTPKSGVASDLESWQKGSQPI